MEPSEILIMLNEFYSNAFSQLIILAMAIFSLGGVIIPLVLNFFQNRSLKNERDSLMIQLKEFIDQMKIELQEDIQKKFDDEIKELEINIDQRIKATRGFSYYQQALRYTDKKDYITATKSYCWTIKSFLASNQEMNVRRAFENLISFVLPFIFKEDYEEDNELSEEIDDLIKVIEENNSNRKYSDDISKIKKLVKKGKITSKNSK